MPERKRTGIVAFEKDYFRANLPRGKKRIVVNGEGKIAVLSGRFIEAVPHEARSEIIEKLRKHLEESPMAYGKRLAGKLMFFEE